MTTLTYETGDRIARITLDRPERGNGITLAMPESWPSAWSGRTSTPACG